MPRSGVLFERILTKDQLLAGLGLGAVTLLSWGYLLTGAGMDMPVMSAAVGTRPASGWSPGYAALMVTMWWVMMVAMMLPSATPMILLFASVSKRAAKPGAGTAATFMFASSYLLVWLGFSVCAAMAQWLLTSLDLLDAMMRSTAPWLGGLLLICAGLYQFSDLKSSCLRHCHSPVAFVMRHWRPGRRGAFKMGLLHGTFCLGCCWALMVLLFFGGVMNIAWIGALAVYVLIEKMTPDRVRLGRITGFGLVAWGSALIGLNAMPY